MARAKRTTRADRPLTIWDEAYFDVTFTSGEYDALSRRVAEICGYMSHRGDGEPNWWRHLC